MSTKNLFEKASRQKLRFASQRGDLTVEQLWDLPLTSANAASLDSIAVGLDTELRNTAPRSFVNSASTGNALLELKLDIVKHIIEVRVEENTRKLAKQAEAQQIKMLDEKIIELEHKELLGGSLEELKAKRATFASQ